MKPFLRASLLFLLPLLAQPATAQGLFDTAQTDAMDIVRGILKMKKPRADSGRVQLSLIPGLGYAPLTGFSVSGSAVLAFRHKGAGAEEKWSNIIAGATYTQKAQIVLPVNAVIWGRDGRWNFLGEWRYMRFPSPTWGLGAYTKESGRYDLDFNYVKLHQSFLWRLRGELYAGGGFFYDAFSRLREIDPPVDGTDLQHYGFQNPERSSGPALRLVRDGRRNAINPDGGTYASITYRFNDKSFGSSDNWQSVILDLRHYRHLRPGGRSILGFWSYSWLTTRGTPPYQMLPSTAWDDSYNSGRGYLQGRYRGRNLLYLESEYRFPLTRNGLFGGVAFANAQAYPSDPFSGLGRVLPGVGAGLRVKLNKYSGTNLAFDYGFGADGSQVLALNLGEVF